jgi:Tfp pilus assembly protein PilV
MTGAGDSPFEPFAHNISLKDRGSIGEDANIGGEQGTIGIMTGSQIQRKTQHARRHLNRSSEGGFTFTEILMTLGLLTIVMTGTAALQVGTINRSTNSSRVAEALRLGQQVLGRYKSTSYQEIENLASSPGAWFPQMQLDNQTEMTNVSITGTGSGPYTVDRIIEASNNGVLITVRISWLDLIAHKGAETFAKTQYATRNVTISLHRFP